MKRNMTLQMPQQFLVLCELLEINPKLVLQEFINNLSLEVQSSGSDERQMAIDYFIRCGYGMPRPYNFEQVQLMFEQLDALRFQWPGNDPIKNTEYTHYRKKFIAGWRKDWKNKRSIG